MAFRQGCIIPAGLSLYCGLFRFLSYGVNSGWKRLLVPGVFCSELLSDNKCDILRTLGEVLSSLVEMNIFYDITFHGRGLA